jgi:hypothetical protein
MAKPYSEDLRGRVVGAGQDGATIPETAEQLGVSISSVVRGCSSTNCLTSSSCAARAYPLYPPNLAGLTRFRRLHRETGSAGRAVPSVGERGKTRHGRCISRAFDPAMSCRSQRQILWPISAGVLAGNLEVETSSIPTASAATSASN